MAHKPKELLGADGLPIPKTPDRTRIAQWGVLGLQSLFGWTVSELSDAISGHNSGSFKQSGLLWEDMRAHPWIGMALEVRREFQTTCPRRVTPAGKTEAERANNARCADFIREVMPQVLPNAVLSDLFDYELGMGGAAFGMDWEEVRDGSDTWWLPVIKPWEPSLLSYRQLMDERSIDGGGWLATTMSHGLIRVDHGGGRWGLVTRRGGRPYLGGLVRRLGEAFVGDGYNFRDNMTHQDRWGRGITEIKFPDYMRQEEVLAMSAGLNDAGGGGNFLSPQNKERGGVELMVHRADGAGYQTFDATEKRILRRIMISILRQDMTTVGNTGIAENDPRALSLWECRKSDVETWGDAYLSVRYEKTGEGQRAIPEWKQRNGRLRDAIWKWIAYYNFGDMEAAPYVWWDATPPDDWEKRLDGQAKRGQQRASTLQSLTTSIKALKEIGVAHDPVWLAEQCGVSMTRPPDEVTKDLERDSIDEIQVRISAAGHPFVPGHTLGVDGHGQLDHIGKVKYHLGQAKQHATSAASAASSLHSDDQIAPVMEKIHHASTQAKYHAQQAHQHAEQHGTANAKKAAEQAKHHAIQAENQAKTAHIEAATRSAAAARGAAGRAMYHAAMAEHTSSAESAAHAKKAAEWADQAANHMKTVTTAKDRMGDQDKAIELLFDARSALEDAKNAARKAKAHSTVENKPDQARNFFGNDEITTSSLASAFSAAGQFDAYPTGVFDRGKHLRVSMNLITPEGRHVGSITRTFKKEHQGLVVKHDLFEIQDLNMQGTGAAKDVFRKSIAVYERVGVKEIHVDAGLSCGRYVWASYGFTAHQSDVDLYKKKFESALREADRHEEAARIAGLRTMQDIADHRSLAGDQIGKNWLLNVGSSISMWKGTMKIKHGDDGFERLKRKIGYT